MKRAVWIGLGVVGTIVVLRQVAKANERFGAVAKLTSPAGIADSIASLAVAAKELGEQVRTSMAENEAALMEALMPSEEELARARDVRAQRRNTDADDPFAAGVEFTDDDWSD
ncbi:hypothetical protein [Ruania zhangjianzhongii]|uniref:hypothetical protein n=1 Tax=Ruania zhangjianzhongii TaxID=2603206 RepID=UPI0011C89D92|nr:hypothetical protein [Ruania zhangjianzhongii]